MFDEKPVENRYFWLDKQWPVSHLSQARKDLGRGPRNGAISQIAGQSGPSGRLAEVGTSQRSELMTTTRTNWTLSLRRIGMVLALLSLAMISGVDDFYIRAYPQLGVPRLRMADGPLGVRHAGPSSAMAGGISLAASWDPALAERVGTEIARDAKAKRLHFILSPPLHPIPPPIT